VGRKVWTFWYGSYMNPAVLAEVDLRPGAFDVARRYIEKLERFKP
jgi:hypothetical protein